MPTPQSSTMRSIYQRPSSPLAQSITPSDLSDVQNDIVDMRSFMDFGPVRPALQTSLTYPNYRRPTSPLAQAFTTSTFTNEQNDRADPMSFTNMSLTIPTKSTHPAYRPSSPPSRMLAPSMFQDVQHNLTDDQSIEELNLAIPALHSKFMQDPTYRKIAQETVAMMKIGEHHRPSSPPPQPLIQPMPPPALPLIAYAGKRPDSPSDEEWPNPSMPPRKSSPTPPPGFHSYSAPDILRPTTGPRTRPTVDWRKLPEPVLECIFSQLRQIHLDQRSRSCNTCHMRDLHALGLTCKGWADPAQKELHSNIAIVGVDSPQMLRGLRYKNGARLALLRRTLRSNPLLSSHVTTLHVPDPLIPIYQNDGTSNPEHDEYVSLIASVVMSCPNLEIFTGFHTFYNHTFDRLTQALSTRRNLKQHVWIIAENEQVTRRTYKQLEGLLDPEQIFQFEEYHRRWLRLETLMMCSPAALGVIEHDCFVKILKSLPRLRNLCVSSFDAEDFDDRTLLQLPQLRNLRLEECEGVSDVGLANWASAPGSLVIERLTLIHQNVNSLATISRLFSNLEHLQKFTIVQTDVTPSLPLDVVVFQPLLASRTIQHIHWDIGEELHAGTSQLNLDIDINSPGNHDRAAPNAHLAMSILHHGFPSLKSLRAPRDTYPSGVLQSVCRPAKNANMLLAADAYSPHRIYAPRQSNSLQAARVRAQNIIDESVEENKEFVKVIVTDHATVESSESSGSEPKSPVSSKFSASVTTSATASTTSTDITEPEVIAPLSAKDLIRLARERRDILLTSPTESDDTITPDTAPSTPTRTTTTPHIPPAVERSPPASIYKDLISHHRSQPSTLSHRSHRSLLIRPPTKIQEFSFPAFVGRVSLHITPEGKVYQPPKFDLVPEVSGRDKNGGIATWGELLRLKERVAGRKEREVGEGWVKDGCVGGWNKRVVTGGNVLGGGNGNGGSLAGRPRMERGMSWSASLGGSVKGGGGLSGGTAGVRPGTGLSRKSLGSLRGRSWSGGKKGEEWRHTERERVNRGNWVGCEDFF